MKEFWPPCAFKLDENDRAGKSPPLTHALVILEKGLKAHVEVGGLVNVFFVITAEGRGQ